GLLIDKRNDFTECDRNSNAIHRRVVVVEIGTCKHRDLHLIFLCVAERVVLKREPDWSVESLHLRRRVGDMHRVIAAALGRFCVLAPARIFSPGHVAPAEFRWATGALVYDLLRFWYARIPFPTNPRTLLRQISIDVHSAEETHPTAATHHHRIVFVPQFGVGLPIVLEV